jgi:predicted nucleic acid binding AN1-type Zn finger protein
MADQNTEPTSTKFRYGEGVFAIVVMCLIYAVMPQSCRDMVPNIRQLKQDKQACRECGGDGKADKTCWECLGRGYFDGHSCTACNKTGKIAETCRFCGGSGKKPKD